jgi:hypothetical protein
MSRYFFHMQDGDTVLDGEGLDLPSPKAARAEAIQACGEMLRDVPNAINNGEPFRLWVTAGPSGQGRRVFTVTVIAKKG